MDKINTGAEFPLRDARQRQGLGLRAVARAAGIDAGQLSRIERGIDVPTLPVLSRLADVLGMHPLKAILEPFIHGGHHAA